MYENTHYRDLQEAFQAGYKKAMNEQTNTFFGGGGGSPFQKGRPNVFINTKNPQIKKEPVPYACPGGSTWNGNGWAGAGCYSDDGYVYDPKTGKWWTRTKNGTCYYWSCTIDDNGNHNCKQVQAPCPGFLGAGT
jgi:hypothetical protein